MSMKTFFTFFSTLFLGVLVSVLIAGYISGDMKRAKEAYAKDKDEQIAKISASLDDAQKKLEVLDTQFKTFQEASAKQATVAPATKTTTTTATKPVSTPTPAVAAPSGTKLTSAVVAKHATADNCWIIVSNKVYGVSTYMAMHPGGKSVIIKTCGKDATATFKDRGGTGEHSDSAWTLLGQFLVGAMGATVKL